MTDRLHSCKESPDGRHQTDGWMCIFCHRTLTFLLDQGAGWNAPAVDPDAHLGAQEWQDEEADVNDTTA